jgi:hypothetical protein
MASSSSSRSNTGKITIGNKVFYIFLTAVNLGILHIYFGLPFSTTQESKLPLSENGRLSEGSVIGGHSLDVKLALDNSLGESGGSNFEGLPLGVTYNLPANVDDCKEGSLWCCSKIPMHVKSYYGFSDLDNQQKWLQSCRLAASGKQVLLPNILKELTHPYDFIDGDTAFQNLHKQVDEFLDATDGFIGRTKASNTFTSKISQTPMSYGNYYEKTPYTKEESMHRVPILASGFMQYSGHSKDFLRGHFLGFKGVSLTQILHHWGRQKKDIPMTERFILITAFNENWGFLSSTFPNRTSKWGRVDAQKFPTLMSFLDDPRLVMLVIGQHSNITHPKILTIPRGLPDAGGFTNHAPRMMHDTMRLVIEKNITKSKLLFSVSSAFGTRKAIVNCVQNSVPSEHFDTSGSSGVTFLSRKNYLLRAARSRFALAPPGLGYDTFRLWEMMNLGTIPIVEKSVGFDRMLYRLPALLVEDFSMITTEMLRNAYIEAVYQKDSFEYNRLTQSYWSELVFQTSVQGSVDLLLKNHPMEAADENLARPLVPYECSNLNINSEKKGGHECGVGTKRPPAKSCDI